MFSRAFVAALVALPAIVTAAPAPSEPVGQCNVGTLSCCDQVQQADHSNAEAAGVLDIPVNLLPLIGINCTPLAALGAINGNNCAAQPVCCEGNNFPSLINVLNCAPVNINI